jgi:molybdopterin molybdotransferase
MTESNESSSRDVRMRGFARRDTVEAALDWLDAQLTMLPGEVIPLREAAGRVLSESVSSQCDVPGFDRAMMDGYAVVADDTEGATEYNPLQLSVLGDAFPGRGFPGTVAHAQAVRIMTGAPIPAGANAVLPAEWVDAQVSELKALAAVTPGKHVGKRGEDVAAGSMVLEANRRLRPQDLGLLSSIGVPNVSVICKPRVRLVITGNELLPPGSLPKDFLIADANGPMLAALVERDGGSVDFPGIVSDDRESICEALHSDAEIVIVSGGSSVGIEDFVPSLLAEKGTLAIHGIAMRPSSPAGMGRLGERLVFLLPGNPVSCLCAYDFFAGRAIRALGARPKEWPYRSLNAPLARKLSSPIGRLDYARVQMIDDAVVPLSVGGASILSSTTRADGFVIVPADSEGFAPGSNVKVWLYD